MNKCKNCQRRGTLDGIDFCHHFGDLCSVFDSRNCEHWIPMPTIKDAMKAMDVIEAEIVKMPDGADKSIAAQSFLDLAVIIAKVNAKQSD